jgi:hypothetical protein
MNDTCAVCGIQFERESGYFLMAIFIGYALDVALLIPLNLIIWIFEPPALWYVYISAAALALTAPWVFRYARVLWLHIDELLDPHRDDEPPAVPLE